MLSNLKGEILLATNNAGKLLELRQLLINIPDLTLLSPAEMGINLDVEETGNTYAENASLKAAAFLQASGIVTLADDSGLEVAALNGEPGLRSKRYAGVPGASDADRRAFLLKNLAGRPRPWTARFVAWVALAIPDEKIRLWEGICPGEIIPEERGNNGFGYDPIFFIPAAGKTMAEFSDKDKNALSHRGNAVKAALPELESLLSNLTRL